MDVPPSPKFQAYVVRLGVVRSVNCTARGTLQPIVGVAVNAGEKVLPIVIVLVVLLVQVGDVLVRVTV